MESRKAISLLLGFAIFFVGFGLVVYQIYLFLRYGQWMPIGIIDGLEMAGFSRSMFQTLKDQWTGLYMILQWIPASIALIASGVLLNLDQ